MGFFDSIAGGVRNYFDKNKEEQQMMEQLQKEADLHRLEVFKEEFQKRAKKVAEFKATKDADEKSGLQKLRAVSRARDLSQEGPPPGSFFEKFSNFTKKNIANRERNLEKTKLMQDTATQERMKVNQEKFAKRNQNINDSQALRNRRPNWRM